MSRRRVAVAVLAGLLVAGEAVALHGRVAPALAVVARARPPWVVAAVLAAAVSMHCLGRLQRRMLTVAGVRLPVRRMVGLAYASNAVNMSLPGGGVASVAFVATRLRRWGTTRSAVAFTVAASGVLSTMTFAALVATSGLAHGDGAVVAGTAGTAAAGLLLLTVPAARAVAGHAAQRLARATTRLVGRLSARAADVLTDLGSVHPTRRDWTAGAGLAAGNWLADIACLLAACHAVGAGVPVPVLLTAYVAGMSASSIAIVPGGFGVVELAMIVALHGGGTGAAAVLLYRCVSCLLVVAAGWVVVALTSSARGSSA